MELLHKYMTELAIPHDKVTLAKFEMYYDLIIEWNSNINLTAITDREEVIIKHFVDSLYGYPLLDRMKTAVDIGSGAGFPGIPLAIVRPDIEFTLVDSLNKRVSFLKCVVDKLGLNNVTVVHSRAEDFARKHRHSYDVATARAVAETRTLLEYLIPLVRIDGKAILYKSRGVDEELAKCEFCMYILKCKEVYRRDYCITDTDIFRSLIVVSPYTRCREIYPRGGNKPKTQPL